MATNKKPAKKWFPKKAKAVKAAPKKAAKKQLNPIPRKLQSLQLKPAKSLPSQKLKNRLLKPVKKEVAKNSSG